MRRAFKLLYWNCLTLNSLEYLYQWNNNTSKLDSITQLQLFKINQQLNHKKKKKEIVHTFTTIFCAYVKGHGYEPHCQPLLQWLKCVLVPTVVEKWRVDRNMTGMSLLLIMMKMTWLLVRKAIKTNWYLIQCEAQEIICELLISPSKKLPMITIKN